jgi:molybdate transport system permease protein
MSSTPRSIQRTKKSDSPSWVFIVPSLFLLGLIGLPILALVWRSANIRILPFAFTESAIHALQLSLFTSMVCVIVAILTGTPLAYLQAHWSFRGKAFLDVLVDLPIVLPPSVAGIALLMAFGRQGIFGSWLTILGISIPFTTVAVVMAQVFVSAPFLVRSARIGFASIDPQLNEAAKVEGASTWHVFQHIMLPLSSRALMTGIVLTWTRALGEFGATLLFAGNLEGKTQTMPLAIYVGFEQGLGIALVLSVILLTVSFVLLVILRRLELQNPH